MTKYQRRSERHHTLFYTAVNDAKTGELIGHLVDISTTGLRLVAPEAREIGEELEISCTLPAHMYGEDAITLRATVRWCKPDVNPDYMALGLELVDVSQHVASILRTLELRHCFDH